MMEKIIKEDKKVINDCLDILGYGYPNTRKTLDNTLRKYLEI